MKPNIIFVLLDGARWDRLHVSKEFLELKKEGIFLNNVTTAAPYTFASMNIIFTGLFGKDNGVNGYYKMFRLKNSVAFLPEILQKNGYFTSCNLISDKVISSRGFDIYQSHDEYNDDLTKMHPELLKQSFELANGKPIFSLLQFSRIHTVTVSEVLKKYDWDDQDFYNNKEENLKNYDETFVEVGLYATKIFDTINKLGKLDETILIFFSDHGTGIGERFGERNYGVFVYEETIRTFYLFIGPKIQKNQEIDQLYSTVDIFPTILDLCNINYETKLAGKSFSSVFYESNKSANENMFTFSETGGLQGPFPSPYGPNVFCIKSPDYKLIYFKTPNKWELYNLDDDPQEIKNLFGQGLEIENKLKEKLLNWIKR